MPCECLCVFLEWRRCCSSAVGGESARRGRFHSTLYNLSAEDSRRLEAARRDLEGKIVRHYLMARGQQEEAAAKAAAAMSDEQRRKTIDVDIPKYIKGSSGDGLLVLLAILLVGGRRAGSRAGRIILPLR